MSLEDLHSMGLLRDEASEPDVGGVSATLLVVSVLVVIGACALMVLGDGNWLTGLGIALFLVGFFALIGVNLVGVMQRAAPGKHEPES